jgi:hypothetical protein
MFENNGVTLPRNVTERVLCCFQTRTQKESEEYIELFAIGSVS